MKRMVAVLLVCFSAAGARANEGQVRLSLKEAIKAAVERNLDVKAELYNPAIAEADIRKNKGIYNTRLTLDTNFNYSVTEATSAFETGTAINRTRQFNFNPGVNQLVPSGGTVGLTFNNAYNKNNASSSRFFLSEYWNSDVSLNFSQPLLKNFGREATELGIKVAMGNKDGSNERFKTKLLETVARARTEYYRLYSLREELEVKRTSLGLARKILSDTQARVKAGVLPAMEILNAEFGVASREKELIDAERAVLNQSDFLRVLLQLPMQGEIIPIDVPTKEPFQTNEEELVRRALDIRPELREQRSNLRTSELQMKVAHNRTLPDLNFDTNVALTGIDRKYNRDLEKVGSADFPVWSVGLKFEYPLGNDAAQNEYIKSRLQVDQIRTQIRSLESNVENNVKIAIRAIETNFKQIEVTDRGKAFAEERLRSFIKKNEVGLATTKDVFDVENDLAKAKDNQIKALVGYSEAITQLWRVTGDLLEKLGITVTEKDGDSLYEQHAR
ncbi:MAG: TolC family protein [Desulfuromonadales bacterium]|nr:MAG: TolC family protein [Desulfuromonadales bacterium]